MWEIIMRAELIRRLLLLLITIIGAGISLGQTTRPASVPTTDLWKHVKTFDLTEISVLAVDAAKAELPSGTYAQPSRKPDEAVRRYPALRSRKPLFGKFTLRIDSQGPQQKQRHRFVIDESAGTGTGYDRMYLDVNGDLDLTNDEALPVLADPPNPAMSGWLGIEKVVCFRPVVLSAEDEVGAGKRSVEVMPRLVVLRGRPDFVSFLPTKARMGTIQVGSRTYLAILGHRTTIYSSYEDACLFLIDPRTGRRQKCTGPSSIMSTRCVDGVHYGFSTTPEGDKLTVRRY